MSTVRTMNLTRKEGKKGEKKEKKEGRKTSFYLLLSLFLTYCGSDSSFLSSEGSEGEVAREESSVEKVKRIVYCKGTGSLSVDEQAFVNSANSGDLDRVKDSLAKVSCPNIQNVFGQSPLYLASAWGHTDIVKVLMKADGIYIDQQSNSGETALHKASSGGHTAVVVELLKATRINTNLRVKSNGYTALHFASFNGHEDVVKVLIGKEGGAHGIQIDLPANHGFTPLHVAAYSGHLAIVQSLVSSGAELSRKTDPGTRSISGKTALELAQDREKNDPRKKAQYKAISDWLAIQ